MIEECLKNETDVKHQVVWDAFIIKKLRVLIIGIFCPKSKVFSTLETIR
jgi:hypothetical protein